ncbi:hypothetical protein AB205_0202550 [Aquarana catesbeiana]|uniref:Uncharacterized protein n=1 Tax=Aquarana catesbeiana TaxID=8400 RepID=A0A2G9SDE8_AQUCT|nr:hypothetical protein AB205_0202550 [Aquarana catesbeiana]
MRKQLQRVSLSLQHGKHGGISSSTEVRSCFSRPEWLHRQIEVITEEDSPVAGTSGAWRARRSRPPERFSPPSSPRALRQLGSPPMVDPPGASALPSTPTAGASTGRNPRRRRSSSGGGRGAVSPPVPLARRGRWEHMASSLNVAPSREMAQRGKGCHEGTGQTVRAIGVPLSNIQDGRSLRSGSGASRAPSLSPLAAGPSRRSAGSAGVRRSAGAGSRPVPVASAVTIPDTAGQPNATFSRSEGELSSSEDERPVRVAAVETGRAAVGPLPVQPDAGVGLVWIMGHSFVFWGAQRVDVRPNGRQLGVPREVGLVAVDRSSWHAVEQRDTGNPQIRPFGSRPGCVSTTCWGQ